MEASKGYELMYSMSPPWGQVPECIYHQEKHYSAFCSVVKTVKDQRSVLIQGGRHFICLKTQHRAKDSEVHKKL